MRRTPRSFVRSAAFSVFLLGCSTDLDTSLLGDATSAGATPGTLGTGGPMGGGTAPMAGEGGTCEQFVLSADRAAPDMLIVLDRSGSMTNNDSNTDRWSGSVDALKTVVAELNDAVRFGLMTFPAGSGGGGRGGRGGGGGGNDCTPGMLNVPISVLNSEPISGALDGMNAGGRTPTAQTLEVARQVLMETLTEVPEGSELGVGARQYVLLVTDGNPNCMTEQAGMGTPDTLAQQATIAEVNNLAGDGVLTYVIGFQTAGSDFASVLDQMAAAGATGDTTHRSVDSGEALLDELRRIAGSAVSCSFVLAQDVDKSRVEIRIDGSAAKYGTDWNLRDDARTIDLLGPACDALQTGAKVKAEVFCHVVNVI